MKDNMIDEEAARREAAQYESPGQTVAGLGRELDLLVESVAEMVERYRGDQVTRTSRRGGCTRDISRLRSRGG